MSDLIVVAFPTETKAEEVRQKLLAMQKEYLIELSDSVVAVKDANGHIKLNQMINTNCRRGRLRYVLGCIDRANFPDATGRSCNRRRVRRHWGRAHRCRA